MGVFFGLVLIVLGVIVMAKLGTVATLQCKRLNPTRVDCQLSSSGILVKTTTAISQLQDAEIARSQHKTISYRKDSLGHERYRTSYRIVLISKDGRIPLTDYYSNGQWRKQNKVNKIRAFLSNPTQITLTIKQDNRWTMYLVGSFLIINGICLIADSLNP